MKQPPPFGIDVRDNRIETPDEALRRLERRPDYHRLIATDEGQRLLEAAAKQAKAARVRE
jgi:hypothetical protein